MIAQEKYYNYQNNIINLICHKTNIIKCVSKIVTNYHSFPQLEGKCEYKKYTKGFYDINKIMKISDKLFSTCCNYSEINIWNNKFELIHNFTDGRAIFDMIILQNTLMTCGMGSLKLWDVKNNTFNVPVVNTYQDRGNLSIVQINDKYVISVNDTLELKMWNIENNYIKLNDTWSIKEMINGDLYGVPHNIIKCYENILYLSIGNYIVGFNFDTEQFFCKINVNDDIRHLIKLQQPDMIAVSGLRYSSIGTLDLRSYTYSCKANHDLKYINSLHELSSGHLISSGHDGICIWDIWYGKCVKTFADNNYVRILSGEMSNGNIMAADIGGNFIEKWC